MNLETLRADILARYAADEGERPRLLYRMTGTWDQRYPQDKPEEIRPDDIEFEGEFTWELESVARSIGKTYGSIGPMWGSYGHAPVQLLIQPAWPAELIVMWLRLFAEEIEVNGIPERSDADRGQEQAIYEEWELERTYARYLELRARDESRTACEQVVEASRFGPTSSLPYSLARARS